MRWIDSCLRSERRVLAVVVLVAALSQGIVAGFHSVGDMSSPNAATWIGHSLAEKGVYEGGWWGRLRGPAGKDDAGLPRMFHLPGEPLYTAAGLMVLPRPLWKFLHVPVTVLLIACAAWWGMKLGGRGMGLITGLIGSFQPFVLLHGMVWDDTFLGASLDWLGAGIVLAMLLRAGKKVRWWECAAVGVVSGYAAITRAASQVVFGVWGILLIAWKKFEGCEGSEGNGRRWMGAAILVVMGVALMAWGLRNRAVGGEFFVGSTHDGITLWESVYPSAIEALVKTGAEERMNNQRMLGDFAQTRHMSELAANEYFLHRARNYMLSHPWATVRTGIFKIGNDLIGWSFDSPAWGARNLISCGSNVLMILLAMPALWGGRMWRRASGCEGLEGCEGARKWVGIVFATQAATTFLLLFFGPSSLRYWMSVQPILWMGDAWMLTRIFWGHGVWNSGTEVPPPVSGG